jgi:hypothetical protein
MVDAREWSLNANAITLDEEEVHHFFIDSGYAEGGRACWARLPQMHEKRLSALSE